MAEDSALTVAVNVFTSPREAFASIRETPRFWLPLVLLLIATATSGAMYVMGVDLPWLYAEQLSRQNPDLTDAELDQVVGTVTAIPRPVLAGISAIAAALVVTIIYLVSALYYRIVSGFTKDGIRYGQWFGLVCWCALPSLLSQLATIVNLATNDITMMPQTEVNPLAIPTLLGMDVTGTPLERIGAYLDPTTIWTLILTILGYSAWTKKSLFSSTLIVVVPVLLVFGALLSF
ncbi:MAG: YIP1 family protein [Gammaproteobacteria bacterium]